MNPAEKQQALRKLFNDHHIAAYVQPVHDMFMSEYPPACFQRVAWLSGFTGSAGTLVVADKKAALFTDGRYTIQAAREVDTALFEVHNSAEVTPQAWLAAHAGQGAIGYDASLFTRAMLAKFSQAMVAVENPIDALWENRPATPASKIFAHDEALAGESAASKCQRIAKAVREAGADALLVAAPDALCWLANLRARDTQCTPLILAHAILYADGRLALFVDPARMPAGVAAHISATHPEKFAEALAGLVGKTIQVDENQTPVSVLSALEKSGVKTIHREDPCTLPKACKNPVQLAGIRAAHIRDGRAVRELLSWLANHSDIETISEMDVAEKLLEFRSRDNSFLEPSFETIAGSGPNGAIVHYRATEKTNRKLKKGELLLIDSGGQYADGTTDITRTVAIGTPSEQQKRHFTLVLKGHIALAQAVFPKATRGSQLDAFARQFLWREGLDYDHGTGHGVGQFLGVHEGPQRIGKRGGDAVLLPGMILSNEPGYYKEGAYGIRIENLVVVVEKENNMLGFETLTCAPLDESLIDESLLTDAEKRWISAYQRWVEATL